MFELDAHVALKLVCGFSGCRYVTEQRTDLAPRCLSIPYYPFHLIDMELPH